MTADTSRPVSQTRSFTTVFLIEMWERFGFYGMQALIVYYMVERMGFADRRATPIWGAAAALIYVAPAFGGWVGDKVLGTRRTMLSGAIVLALGYALMAIPSTNSWALFAALGVVVVGNGLFKANAGNLVRKIYEGESSKIDSAFTIYYMAVNIGSMISIWLTPIIKDYINARYGHGLGWHAAFSASCLGLLIGLANYLVMRHTLSHIGSEPDRHPAHKGKLALVLLGCLAGVGIATVILQYEMVARIFVFVAGAAVLAIFAYLISHSERHERAGLAAALILVIETIIYFIFYQQMPTSLNLFALRNVDPSFGAFGVHFFTFSPAQFQALNPVWIFILSPILALLYTRAGKKGGDLNVATKFALGFAAVAIGFFVFSAAGHFLTSPGLTSPWTMVWGYGLTSLGELLISGLGLAMVARYVPARMGGFMMGAYFVSSGVAQYLGGWLSTVASVPDTLRNIVANTAGPVVARAQEAYPAVMSMSLENFRKWLAGTETGKAAASKVHLPADFASLPQHGQDVLQQLNEKVLVTTMPIYTTLFFWLGVAAVIATILTFAVLPLMRRLHAQHHSHNQATEGPLPTIGSEE